MTVLEKAVELADFHCAVIKVMNKPTEIPEPVWWENLYTVTLIKANHVTRTKFWFRWFIAFRNIQGGV